MARLPRSVCADTPFDLASLTKPCVALTAATLARSCQIQLKNPLGIYLPEAVGSPVENTSLEMLLSHRSGLRPHIELFGEVRTRRASNPRRLLRRIALHGLASRENGQVHAGQSLYSDLGYILVGAALERQLRAPLDELVADSLCHRAGLAIGSSRQWRRVVPRFDEIVAPTEHVGWRGGMICGQVHDENAWALAGYGLAGHAGLFGTAPAVARLGCAVIDALAGKDPLLDKFAAHYCTGWRSGGTLRAGFDGKSQQNSSAGSLLSAFSFGHLGFTGTSLWCDPEQRIVVALLTNRVCPTRRNVRFVAARRSLHDLLVGCTRRELPGGAQ